MALLLHRHRPPPALHRAATLPSIASHTVKLRAADTALGEVEAAALIEVATINRRQHMAMASKLLTLNILPLLTQARIHRSQQQRTLHSNHSSNSGIMTSTLSMLSTPSNSIPSRPLR